MKIFNTYPPNYKRICEVFNIKGSRSIVFTYDGVLYNPGAGKISQDLMVHEETHVRQQKEIGVDVWWDKYLTDAEFRTQQELEAYRVQWRYAKEHYARYYNRLVLKHISRSLAGEMYGNLMTKKEAEEAIRSEL